MNSGKILMFLITIAMMLTLMAKTSSFAGDGPTTVPAHADGADRPTTAPSPKSAHYLILRYPLPPEAKEGVVEFYNECVVQKDVKGSYFCVAAFANGYFGIQDRPDKKVGIFSVWDNPVRKTNDPTQVDEKSRTRPVFVGDHVHFVRFGNEGTGAHSDFDYDWAVGNTYQFFLRATIKDAATEYEGWFRDPASGDGWKHIATFSAPDGGKKMTRLYSFLEDFRRDTKSATEIRRSEFGNGWVRATPESAWLPLTAASLGENKYATQDPVNFDAGVSDGRFYLQNGLGTEVSTPIGTTLKLPATDHRTAPDAPQAASPIK